MNGATDAVAETGCAGDGSNSTVVAEYMFQEGSGTITINSGTGGAAGDATLTNGVVFSTDVPAVNSNCGWSVFWPNMGNDGHTPAVETAGGYDPLAGATNFTIMAWVKRESAASNNNTSARIVSDTSALTSGSGFEFRFSGSAGTLALRINGNELSTTVGGIAPNSNTWHHVAVVYDGTRPATNALTRHAHFYVDGIQRGLGVSNATLNVTVAANTNKLTIGNSAVSRSVANALVGKIDDVRILRGFAPDAVGNGKTNDVIRCYRNGADDHTSGGTGCAGDTSTNSTVVVEYLFQEGSAANTINSGTDGEAGDATLVNGASFNTDAPPSNANCGWSVDFPDIGGGTLTPAVETSGNYDPPAGATSFTIMAWVKRESASNSSNTAARIISTSDPLIMTGNGVELRFSGAEGSLALRINSNLVTTSSGGIAPTSNTWHHVAVVYDGTRPATNALSRNVHFYVDGIQRGLGNTLTGKVVGAGVAALTIGNSAIKRHELRQLVGKLDDVRILRGFAPDAVGNGKTNDIIRCYMNAPGGFGLPTIICPPDQVVEAGPCLTPVTNIDLGQPTVSSNCGVESVTNDAPAQFPVGTRTVMWTVRDTAGNTATCAQQVIVEPSRTADCDGDGVADWDEVFVYGTDPTDYYNGIAPVLSIVSGNNQTGLTNSFLPDPLVVRVTSTSGTPLVNAPVTFNVTQGDAQLATAFNGTPLSSVLQVRSGFNGHATVYVHLGQTAQANHTIAARAQSGANSAQTTFTAQSTGTTQSDPLPPLDAQATAYLGLVAHLGGVFADYALMVDGVQVGATDCISTLAEHPDYCGWLASTQQWQVATTHDVYLALLPGPVEPHERYAFNVWGWGDCACLVPDPQNPRYPDTYDENEIIGFGNTSPTYRFHVAQVRKTTASLAKPGYTPVEFVGHKPNFGDPCDAQNPGKALAIFYKDVTQLENGQYQVQDFDVTLSATVVKPDGVSVDGLMPRWSNASVNQGSGYGELDNADSSQATFKNPKKGGLYKFAFNFYDGYDGYAPCSNSTAQVLLPLAGADIASWLDTEIKDIPAWARDHKAVVVAANASIVPFKEKYNVYRTWARISAQFFDNTLVARDESGQAPCMKHNVIGNKPFLFVTVNGVVVHGSKVNNMLWAVFGRAWGYSTDELKLGAHINEFGKGIGNMSLRLDPISSQRAIQWGGQLYDAVSNNPNFDVKNQLSSMVILQFRQDDDDLPEENLWPAGVVDMSTSTLTRPSLPYTP